MTPTQPTIPTISPTRAIMLPASFAACAVLGLVLLVLLSGCTSFGTAEIAPNERVDPPNPNTVLCSCECEGYGEAGVPSPTSIREGRDDVTQTAAEANAVLNRPTLALGAGNSVGLRFQQLGVPRGATIDAAFIQFTAAQNGSGPTSLAIRVINTGNAEPFTTQTDLRGLPVTGQVEWAPPDWVADERVDAQKTPDLKALVQAIVSRPDYNPDAAIAFVITGAGQARVARAFEQAGRGLPATLTVTYTPLKLTKEFQVCGDTANPAAVCEQRVQSNVSFIANQCKLAQACTCKAKIGPGIDTISFSAACNEPCQRLNAPGSCDPEVLRQATAATDSHDPVCVANSPLGSVLFGQLSACEIEGTPNCRDIRSTDGDNSCVSVRVFDGDDSLTEYTTPRGRIELAGTPCPGGACSVGLRHRIHLGDITFEGGLFDGDHTLVDLSGAGASSQNAPVGGAGNATFEAGSTRHSLRGREVDGETIAAVKTNNLPLDIGLGGWQPGGVCTLRGMVFQGQHVEVFANIRGRLVNQPPTAALSPDETVECNDTGLAAFALDASVRDPDNNAVSFAWLRGGRTGSLVGALSTVELEQAVNTTQTYVFKAVDAFGQYAEATTSIEVVDTTAPVITAPPPVTKECESPAGTAVDLGMAQASDVCDAAPAIGNNALPLFPLGETPVVWTARDASGNVGSATQIVTIVDTTPPELTVAVSPPVLWPPNHKLEPITATITVVDKCDPNPTVQLISITSSEPENGSGDGNTLEDIQEASLGTDDRSFLLRAERSGSGSGRVYTIKYKARDASGNTTVRTATVAVPKSQSAH